MGKNKQMGHKSDVLGTKADSLKNLLATLGGSAMVLDAKEFKSGKVGFSGNGTATIKCGPAAYRFSVSLNVTAIDSDKSPLPEGAREAILSTGSLSLKDLGLDRLMASPREFSSGKVGYYFGDKASPVVGGIPVRCQIGCSIVAWHSDGWGAERPQKAAKQDKDQAPAE